MILTLALVFKNISNMFKFEAGRSGTGGLFLKYYKISGLSSFYNDDIEAS